MTKLTQPAWWQPALTLFAEISGWIVVPIVGALFLGNWLDEKNGTYPVFYLGLTGLAFAVSCTGIVLLTGKYLRKIEKESQAKKKIDNRKTNNNEPGSSSK